MPRVRKNKPNGITVSDARLSILVPTGIDRQLRALAARRGSSVSPIIREWIIEKLREVDQDGRVAPNGREPA